MKPRPATPPSTDSIIQATFRPAGTRTINLRRGFPVSTPTDPQDYLWTPWHPVPIPRPGEVRQLKMTATMPADGDCDCVIQIEGRHEIRRILFTAKGRSVHLLAVPPDKATLGIYLRTDASGPTAITVYSPK